MREAWPRCAAWIVPAAASSAGVGGSRLRAAKRAGQCRTVAVRAREGGVARRGAASEKGVRLAQNMQVRPRTPVGIQRLKAEVGPTSEPTWRLSHWGQIGGLRPRLARPAPAWRARGWTAPDPPAAAALPNGGSRRLRPRRIGTERSQGVNRNPGDRLDEHVTHELEHVQQGLEGILVPVPNVLRGPPEIGTPSASPSRWR